MDYLEQPAGFVYVWENLLNGHSYCGKHKGTPNDGYIGSGSVFKAAWEKYGEVNFERRIVYQGPLYHEVETLIIRSLDLCDDPDWYNLSHIHNRTRHGKATREKLSVSCTGQKKSAETRAKMSAAKRNMSPEHRAKLSAAKKGRSLSDEHRAKIAAGLKAGRLKSLRG